MKRLTCFWVLWLSYLMCIKCANIFVGTSTVNPVVNVDEILERNWRLFRGRSNAELREPRWSDLYKNRGNGIIFVKINELDGGKTVVFNMDTCSRYCISRNVNKSEDNVQYINLIWTLNNSEITDEHLSKDHLLLLPKVEWEATQQSANILKNCQIYLDLDCNMVEGGTASNYANREFHLDLENSETDEQNTKNLIKQRSNILTKIVEKYNLRQQSQTKFSVNSSTPRIIFNIDGNVSSAQLRIPTNATVPKQGMTISWSRKNSVNGARIDVRNAPPGEWWLKLEGVDNSKYHFTAEGVIEEKNSESNLFFPDRRMNVNINAIKIGNHRSTIGMEDATVPDNNATFNEMIKLIKPELLVTGEQNLVSPFRRTFIEKGKIIHERSLKHRLQNEDQSEQKRMQDISRENHSPMISTSTENELIELVEYITANVTTSENSSSEKTAERTASIEEQEKVQARSSIGMIENLDIDDRSSKENSVNVSMRMIEALDNRELSEELVNYSNENIVEEKRMLIEVNRNSNLLVAPGTIHRIVFDVKNNCVLPVRYTFRVRSTPFRVYNVQPVYAWIYPGQMSKVAVDLIVPENAGADAVNTVTLSIFGTEIKEKSVYLYVQGSLSKLTDDVKPTIEYSFNNNCAEKLEKDRCYKSRWSVDIKIQDYDSGLKRVISSPNNIVPQTEFISGTRSQTTFYYSSSCCDKTAKITAIDLLDNYNTYTIDVTAWNNLSQAEIAAITVGSLLALLLVILIIILIVYCIRKRKSHDLPYTQRYGSRPPAHSERTNL